MILASDDEHEKLFRDVPISSFKIKKKLKAHLVRSQLSDLVKLGNSNRVEEK